MYSRQLYFINAKKYPHFTKMHKTRSFNKDLKYVTFSKIYIMTEILKVPTFAPSKNEILFFEKYI